MGRACQDMAVARVVPQAAADKIANLDRATWVAWQDMAVARVVPQAVADRVASLDRTAVVGCSVPVGWATVEDRLLELAAGVTPQSLSYALDKLALHLQYCYLKQLLALGALAVYPHYQTTRIV